ncbi:hypothetical protein ACTFIU_011042 [Dictyostelium citrinum]
MTLNDESCDISNKNNNNFDKRIPSLTDHSVFYRKKKLYEKDETPLDFEMEWDPDHKIYTPPTLTPSLFNPNLKIINNNTHDDTTEKMSIDEIQINNNIQTTTTTTTTNNNNDIQKPNNIQPAPQQQQPAPHQINVNKEKENDINDIVNKVTINDFEYNQQNKNNEKKVKKSSASMAGHGHHLHNQQQIVLQKKPWFQRYGSKNINNNNNNNNNYSPMLSPPILFNNNSNNNQLQQQQHQLYNNFQNQTNSYRLSEVLEGYLYLIVRFLLICLLFFGIYITFNSILHDVNFKYKQYSAELTKQLEKCTKLYSENRCSPLTRIPAMEQQCTEWELCMAKDPSTLPKSKILAEILSEVLDSFVSTMSYKTIVFLICIIWMMIWIPNKLLANSNNNNNNNNKKNNNIKNNNNPFLSQHLSSPQPTQSIFAKNLFTIEQNDISKNFERRLISDWNK